MLIPAADIFNEWWPKLGTHYDQPEAQNLTKWLLEDYFQISSTDLLLNKSIEVNSFEKMDQAITRLRTGEPIQHILGYAWFHDLKFKVSPDVLIPRQETEELVALILKDHPDFSSSLLDIGTGSGIIPVCLKKELPKAKMTGLDISNTALTIAQQNARMHEVDINWIAMDILHEMPDLTFDIIVSNPPYVLESDKKNMHTNVLNHDPGLALFVPDESPLIFYERMLDLSESLLNPGGYLYFEIHENFGEEVSVLMKRFRFEKINVFQDLNGKDRMVKGIKKG